MQYILFIVILTIYSVIKLKKPLHMFQQNLYNMNNRYLKWCKNNINEVIFNFDLVMVISLLVFYILKIDIKHNHLLIFLLIILSIYDINLKKRDNLLKGKKPLVITARVKRLLTTYFIIYLIPIILFYMNIINGNILTYILIIFTYLTHFLLVLVNIINKPIEKLVYIYYYQKAVSKLRSMSNLKVVGITGSYGKTSSKNILNDVLKHKYLSLASPKNLNTEYGLMITINNHLSKFDNVFIAEMGAYKQGEIKILCDMVKPKYGILTKVGTAHLETFGSQENIQKTKFELIDSLPSDGVGVLNGDDDLQINYKTKSKCKKVWIGIDNKDVDIRAENIKCNHKGSTFDVIIKNNNKKYSFVTKLLGKNNIYNILASIALALEFGMSMEDIIFSVKKVNMIEHRLEIKTIGNFYMIDDAYNSNPVGAKSAIDVLNMMPGYKVVVTPGMIELGSKEEFYNKEFGRQIAKVSDYTILVGEKKTRPIYDGLIEEGYPKNKIKVINNVKEAYNIINNIDTDKEVYALFENDLPDIYNE